MNDKAEDLAFGRWPDILMAAGMEASFFSGKGGPCPFCGGKDRYRWSQKKFGGVWVCNTCTGDKYSNGFNMLMQHMGYQSFRDAADHVREFFGANPSITPIPRSAQYEQSNVWTPEKIERNRKRMQTIWDEAYDVQPGDPVSLYMRSRVPGMDFMPERIRFHPRLAYWAPPPQGSEKPIKLGEFCAMLAYAEDAQGNLAQLHKTYLTFDGRAADVPLRKKTDLGVGSNSFAVRMMEPIGHTLGVCEGIETGWASAMFKGVPIWPCLNGPAMSEFELPEYLRSQIKTLIIFTDSDELKPVGRQQDGANKWRRAGSAYAEKLAQKARDQGLRTLIIRPAKVGADMADYWESAVVA